MTNLQRSGTYHDDDQPAHLRIKPDYASAHYHLGNALRELGHFEEAVTHLQHTLRGTPNSLAVQIELADTACYGIGVAARHHPEFMAQVVRRLVR